MTTLRNLRPKVYSTKVTGEIGLEIETETKFEYASPVLKHWSTHQDGSLRNFGVEYVLKTPLNYNSDAYKECLLEFAEVAKTKKFLDSTYTSVHVHLNMVNKPLKQLMNFITLYVLFENVLTKYCGPDRDGNLFCLKTSDAELSYLNYAELATRISEGMGASAINDLNAQQLKYSALNIAPLRNLGSVEVRTHGGTTDVGEIDRWVGMLMCLYNAASKYSDPVEIVSLFSNNSDQKLTDRFFGKYSEFLKVEKDSFRDSLYYASVIASSVADWKNFGMVEKKKTKFEKTSFVVDDVYYYTQDMTEEDLANRVARLRYDREALIGYTQTFEAGEDL